MQRTATKNLYNGDEAYIDVTQNKNGYLVWVMVWTIENDHLPIFYGSLSDFVKTVEEDIPFLNNVNKIQEITHSIKTNTFKNYFANAK